MKNKRVVIEDVTVWMHVDTKWGRNLAFVLEEADKRKGDWSFFHEGETTYTKKLSEMIKNELPEGFILVDTREYGEVSFAIESQTLDNFEDAIEKCNIAVDKWVKRYRIENMKYSGEQ